MGKNIVINDFETQLEIEKINQLRTSINQINKQSISIKNNLIEIKNELNGLTNNLNLYKKEYLYYKKLKNKTSNAIKKILKKIEINQIQLEDYNKIKEDLSNELSLNIEYLKKITTNKLLKKVYEVTPENSIHNYVYKDTTTIDLMDNFENSNKEFLILSIREFRRSSYLGNLNLIICKCNQNVYTTNLQPTMTELKKWEGSRLSELKKCVYECISSKDFKTNTIKPLTIPCKLGAQNSSNRTGYGDEWRWGELISEGTKYGEVSDYYIIGLILKNFY